ncbi:Oligopeptidase A [hydrothermal vent metagenome]|uniref:oligopeptidase A n=1 Tax=hydrothermal vent metagenome TaxID=652676 RepID=A0A3B1CV39_9ZZZZ
MTNPLLNANGLPQFSKIKPEHVIPAVDQLLHENRQKLTTLLAANGTYTWQNLIHPLEAADEKLDRAFSPISHLNAVVNSEALREVYNACLPKLSDYATELGQHEGLFRAYTQIAEGPEYATLDAAQKKIIDNALRDFRLSGIGLGSEDKARYKVFMKKLSTLSSQFSDNILDATNAWKKEVSDEKQLAGLPESAVAMAKQIAEREGLSGWVFNLEFPSYLPVMTYADDRALREVLYRAYVTRASDQGPNAGKWDNSQNMEEILALRHQIAALLGFENYADYSLATKMATSTDQVMSFLNELAEKSHAMAQQDLQEVRDFAKAEHGFEGLEAWDLPYYSEKLQEHKYAITQEELKPYFSVDHALAGLFAVVNRLYGLTITAIEGVETWHEDVRFFEIRDRDNQVRGQFFLDLYARPHKRGGAWMGDCMTRKRTEDGIQTPVAYLVCNFSPPVGDSPALFTHDEVQTLFHEFGHGLHHMLTQVDYLGVSGIGGVPWDAVELPSQFMENWCWQKEALDLFARHYQTKEKLPEEMFQRMLAAKNFQSAMQMVRQLEFALFDFRIHMEFDPKKGGRVFEILEQVRKQVSVMQTPAFNRFPHSFSHIFAGGYSAGYYSYKWAEVLSADAFSLFEERGIFDQETGLQFMTMILEQGGSREPMEMFVNFRGREPEINALLRHSGLGVETA